MRGNRNFLSQFWKELKRRRVIHVTIVYATAAFVIIELVNNITDPLNLPAWTPTFAIIVLLIGFPLALIFAWIFDLTPEGLEKTRPVEEVKEELSETSIVVKKRNQSLGKVINLSLVGLLLIIIATYLVIRFGNYKDPLRVHRFVHHLPQGGFLGRYEDACALDISPDGTKLVYVSLREDTSSLYLLELDKFEAELIPGTMGAMAPFFSPDGKWVGYFADGYLRKVSILGGAPHTICEAKSGWDACWSQDNTIIFSDSYKRGLLRVSSEGGTPEQITNALTYIKGEEEQAHFKPQILPGGDVLLFSILNNMQDIRVAALSLKTGKKWKLIEHGSSARYVPSGHLVYTWKGDLMAVPFNLKKMKVSGDPMLVLEGVMMDDWSSGHYSVSNNGTLVYVPGDFLEPELNIVMVNDTGAIKSLDLPTGKYQSPRISPDGKQFLITRVDERANVWIYGMERGTYRRFSANETETFWAIWTPDGKEIVFNSNLHGGAVLNLYRQKMDGTRPAVRLSSSQYHQLPKTWSADGKQLIFMEGIHPETGLDINILSLEGDSISRPLLNTPFNETQPDLSPDGRWLAYVSDHVGREEVFVSQFPHMETNTQISIDGGMEPLWAPDGKQLFYRDLSGDRLMAVSVRTDSSLQVGKPSVLFEGKFFGSAGPWGRNYDIMPDGHQFLMISEMEMKLTATQINFALNWFEELNILVPTDP